MNVVKFPESVLVADRVSGKREHPARCFAHFSFLVGDREFHFQVTQIPGEPMTITHCDSGASAGRIRKCFVKAFAGNLAAAGIAEFALTVDSLGDERVREVLETAAKMALTHEKK